MPLSLYLVASPLVAKWLRVGSVVPGYIPQIPVPVFGGHGHCHLSLWEALTPVSRREVKSPLAQPARAVAWAVNARVVVPVAVASRVCVCDASIC